MLLVSLPRRRSQPLGEIFGVVGVGKPGVPLGKFVADRGQRVLHQVLSHGR